MNCKHLRKISVMQANILTRQLGKSSNPSRQHESNTGFQVFNRNLNLHKNTIQAKPLPSSEVRSRIGLSSDICKSPDFKFLAYNPPYKYDQRRNYSSLLERIKNFIMSVFNNKNSDPLLKADEPTEPKKNQTNKLKASASSPTVTPSKSVSPQISLPSMLQWAKSKTKQKSEGQELSESKKGQKLEVKDKELATEKSLDQTPESLKKETKSRTATGPEAEDMKRDLVADSLMKETAQRLDVENKRKPPFRTEKGHFAEDRMAMEMPKKRREKIELEQEMKEERIEEAEDVEMYKVMDDVRQKPKKASETVKKLEGSKLCDHDDVFCGVEQYDDVKAGERTKRKAQILAAKKTKEKKTTQVFTSKGQVKPTGLVPKRGKGFEKNFSTSAVTPEANRRTETPVFFTSNRPNRIGPNIFSIRLSEKHYDKNVYLTTTMFSKLPSQDLHENILDRNAKSTWTLTEDKDIDERTPKIIQKDPLEIFEQKEPKPASEVKEPDTNSCELIEPINKESCEDPSLEIPLVAKGKKIVYGRDAKEEEKKKDDERKKERKAICTEENRQMVIEEPCSQNKPLCCYNPPKRLLEIDLTDKCNAKCVVAPQKPPPLMDCSLCKKYDTLEDDVPKPKPMVCTVGKCSKPSQECPPSASAASTCTKSSRHTELCAGSCSMGKGCATAKTKAKQSSSDPCSKQKMCPKKGKTKSVACPSMPKACIPKPKEKQATECKKKTCSTINTASKMDEAKKKEKEAERKREREKKCNPKTKKKPVDTCKVLSECEKKKLKAEEDKRKAEENARKPLDPKLHTEWKAVPIKGSGRWCDKKGGKEERETPIIKPVTPNLEKKYQSPRYERKPCCNNNKPSTSKDDSTGRKKCIPVGVIDESQSLGTIENSLYFNNGLLGSDDGNQDERNKKGPAIPPFALAEKSKSDSEIL